MDVKPTVFVVDDEEQIRLPLGRLLQAAEFHVEAFASAEEFLAAYEGAPGCIVLDIRLEGGMNGLALQQTLSERGYAIPILFMSAYANVPTTVRAMKAGAVDVLEKPFDSAVLIERIRAAIAQDLQGYEQRTRLAEALKKLSKRQRQVMQLLIEAHDTKQIARELGISPKTVEKHRANVLVKMHVDSVVELMRNLMPAITAEV